MQENRHRTGLLPLFLVLAVLLGLAASYGVAWGALNDTDYPYGVDVERSYYNTTITRGTDFTLFTPPSSASYFVYRWSLSAAGIPTLRCGATVFSVSGQVGESGWQYVPCDGYSLKVNWSGSGTATMTGFIYRGPEYEAPSLGTVEVDTSTLEEKIQQIFDLAVPLGAFLLFFFILFGVITSLRRR